MVFLREAAVPVLATRGHAVGPCPRPPQPAPGEGEPSQRSLTPRSSRPFSCPSPTGTFRDGHPCAQPEPSRGGMRAPRASRLFNPATDGALTETPQRADAALPPELTFWGKEGPHHTSKYT